MKIVRTVFAFALVASVMAQEAPTAPKASIALPTKVKAGAPMKGMLTLTFVNGWHGYQNPPLDEYQNPVTLSLGLKGWKLQQIGYPKGIIMDMAGTKAAVYEGEVKIPFVVVTPKKVGKTTLEFVLAYQQCNDSTCLPPTSLTLKVPVTLTK